MGARGTAPEGRADEGERSTLALLDRAGHVRLNLIVREVRQRNGHLVALKSGAARVVLSHRKKEIAIWSGGRDEPETVVVTADGYRALNTVAQITVMTPPSIHIPGLGKMANPYVRLATGTQAFQAGWCRKIAIAPGPTGNLTLCDRTTYLSLVEYLIEDLIGVSKKNPTAVVWGTQAVSPANDLADVIEQHNADKRALAEKERKDWPLKYLISDAERDRAMKEAKKPGRWGFYPIEEVTGQGLWFDRRAEAVVRVFGSYTQKGKFGVRQLEAICYRNVLRDHPLMPGMQIKSSDLKDVWASPELQRATEEAAKGGKAGPAGALIDRVAEASVFFHEQEQDEEAVRALVQEFEQGLRTAAYTEIDPEKATTPQRAGRDDAETHAAEEPEDRDGREVEPDDGERAPVPGRSAARPDPVAALLAEITTAEGILGLDATTKILAKFPAVKGKLRRTVAEKDLSAYYTSLKNAINAKAAGA